MNVINGTSVKVNLDSIPDYKPKYKPMLTIKVEPLPGSDIEATFIEATLLSKKLNCYIEFMFNGVRCVSHPDGNSKKGAENYLNQLSKDIGRKFAINI